MHMKLVALALAVAMGGPGGQSGASSDEPRHHLELRPDGTVWASGNNEYGQLGDGSATERRQPVKVRDLAEVVAVAAARRHSAALKADGTVWAWGDNSNGQLGDNTKAAKPTPVRVMRLKNVVSIDCRESYCLARKADGSVWKWGKVSDAEDADGGEEDVVVPAPVSGPTALPSAPELIRPNEK